MSTAIARHKTAMTRSMLSRPVARAVEDGLLSQATSVLDYGCGRGGDLVRLARMGIQCTGYDPVYRPNRITAPSAVVNLGYVLNVIESEAERIETLRSAWRLAERTLIVSARLETEARDLDAIPHKDGYLTRAGTFQKFFTQLSLREFIETTLNHPAVAAAPGVFYVFRDAHAEQGFLARRIRRAARPRSEVIFSEHQELLTRLVAFLEEKGRLPRHEERAAFADLERQLGSVRNAFLIIRRVTGEERWDRARMRRSDDLLVYLALSRFRRRPQLSALPHDLQHDIKDFFGSYKAACEQADRLLFAIAEGDRMRAAIAAAPVGKRTRDALYVHMSAVGELVPLLRVLEGCARVLLGTIEEATLVKFGTDRAQVSYLEYPNFDSEGHPALRSAYVVDLESLRLDYRDYSRTTNPPILHRKELFVSGEHPLRARFKHLTLQEARAGLYRDPEKIGTRRGWEAYLEKTGVLIKGHRVVRTAAHVGRT